MGSGVFSTGAMDALAPAILGQSISYYSHRPLAPTILGQSITVSIRNSKVLNTPLVGGWSRKWQFSLTLCK